MPNSIQLCVHGTLITHDSNSEASSSQLLSNREEMFLQYYIGGDVISRFKSSTTHTGVVPAAKGLIQNGHSDTECYKVIISYRMALINILSLRYIRASVITTFALSLCS